MPRRRSPEGSVLKTQAPLLELEREGLLLGSGAAGWARLSSSLTGLTWEQTDALGGHGVFEPGGNFWTKRCRPSLEAAPAVRSDAAARVGGSARCGAVPAQA
jgi:hypothetical protein